MKTLVLSSLFFLLFVLQVQGQLNTAHNHMRAGDMLIKQQVEYIDPGSPGNNRVWDFSKLKTINDEYTLTYSLPPMIGDSVYILGNIHYNKKDISENELIVGTEHNTMYYYHLTGDSLLQTGHENPSVKLAYILPIVKTVYPLNYGQKRSSYYKSEGLYSGTVAIHTYGCVTTVADAYGKILLPTGDTLSPVLRVKTIQTILNTSSTDPHSYDTGEIDLGKQLETYRWYSKGYRYPVFETVRSINLKDSSEIFKTAFFFPPLEHLYLDTDLDNQALLDQMWNMEEKREKPVQDAKIVSLEDIMICKIYPNPVTSLMNLDYELKEEADISFELYSLEGIVIKKIGTKKKEAGNYYETIDCSALYPKNYVLRITANGLFLNEVVIKK